MHIDSSIEIEKELKGVSSSLTHLLASKKSFDGEIRPELKSEDTSPKNVHKLKILKVTGIKKNFQF